MNQELSGISDLWIQVSQALAPDPAELADPAMVVRIVLQIILLAGSAFFSGSETALFSLSDVDLEQLRRQRHPRADLLHGLLSQPRRLIISILSGNELINIAATANLTAILAALYGVERAGLISVFIMVPLLLLLGEITPKTISVSYPVGVSTEIVCVPMSLWVRLITPLRWVVRILADRVTTWIVGEARDVDHILRISEFRSLVADIEEEGLLGATDRVLVYNLLDAGNTEIIHIMTPRTQVRFAHMDTKASELAHEFLKHRRLRMPVYQENRDDIRGFVHVEDVAGLILGDKDLEGVGCRDLLRPPLFVPPTKSVDELLDFFQSHDERAAMIVNEFGGISGMVTIEDALNFIFGEIAGEFLEDGSYVEEDEQVFMVSGQMKLNQFNALTNFGIEDPRMTTIGGVALRHLGRLPKEGDTVTLEDLKMEVLEMDGNRIARLRVSKVGDTEEDARERPGPIPDEVPPSDGEGG